MSRCNVSKEMSGGFDVRSSKNRLFFRVVMACVVLLQLFLAITGGYIGVFSTHVAFANLSVGAFEREDNIIIKNDVFPAKSWQRFVPRSLQTVVEQIQSAQRIRNIPPSKKTNVSSPNASSIVYATDKTTLVSAVSSSPSPSVAKTTNRVAGTATSVARFFNSGSLGKVTIMPKVDVMFTKVTSIAVDKGKTFFMVFTIKNESNEEVDFNKYWFNIQATNGAKFKPQLAGALEKIPAKSERVVELTLQTPLTISGVDLRIQVIRWDFSVTGFQRKIGDFRIPKGYKNAAPPFAVQIVKNDAIPLRTAITRTGMSEDTKYQYVTFTMEIKNEGSQTAVLGDQEMVLRTSTGVQFPMRSNDWRGVSIQPFDQAKFDFVGSIPKAISIKNAQIVWFKKVTSSKVKTESGSLNVPVAFFILGSPSATGLLVPAKQNTRLEIDKKSIEIAIKSAAAKIVNTQRQISISLNLTNQSSSSVAKIPTYDLRIKTKTGELYDVNTEPLTKVSLLPKIMRTVTVNASMPKETKLEQLVLVVSEVLGASAAGAGATGTTSSAGGDIRIPVASFALEFKDIEEKSSSEPFNYADENYDYEVRIQEIERLPWTRDDFLYVYAEVTNRSLGVAPVPTWDGKVWFDGIVTKKTDLSLININNPSALAPGEKVQLIYRGNLSFTQKYKKLNIQLTNRVNEEIVDVLQAVDTRSVGSSTLATLQPKYIVVPEGIRSELTVIGTRIYQSDTNDLVYTQMEWINQETRQATPPAFYAYYRTQDGSTYPATIVHTANKIGPQQKTLLSMRSTFSKNIKRDNMQLFVGLGLKGTALANQGEALDGYVNLRAMTLGFETSDVKNNLSNLFLRPYTFSVSQYIVTPTSGSTFDLKMTYKLDRSTDYVEYPPDKKLLFEIKDVWTGNTGAEEVILDGEKALKLGTEEITIKFDNVNLVTFQTYSIRVYELVDKQKRLLAETTGKWFAQY